MRFWVATGVFGVCAAALLVVVLGFGGYRIPSASMEPTLDVGDRVITREVLFDAGIGDVVIYRDPTGQFDTRISRIGAVGGDTVEGVNGDVLRNGRVVEEDFIPADMITPPFDLVEVPDGEVFLLSDNRGNSFDSRHEGPLDADDVVGVVQFTNVPIDWLALGAAAVSGAVWLWLLVRRYRTSPAT